MSRLPKLMALAMLVFYALAVCHCDLEQIPGFAFLSCCHHESAPHQDNDCREDACSVVESGFYKITDQDDTAPVPLLLLSWVLPHFDPVPPGEDINICSSAPPELPCVWQFCFRTALLPRAPSSVS